MNFEKLLGQQVFKKHNFSPFQSPSRLSICASIGICCIIYIFFSCFVWLFVHFGSSHCLNFDKFRHRAPLIFTATIY